MKLGYDLFSESDVENLFDNDWKIKDDESPEDTSDWKVEFMSSYFKKEDWDFKDFMKELGKQIEEGKTFDELADFFWV
tara:strand:- start:2062 stop:2295 length:234 start_codon:yes stop_codon:yes gene_type:complete